MDEQETKTEQLPAAVDPLQLAQRGAILADTSDDEFLDMVTTYYNTYRFADSMPVQPSIMERLLRLARGSDTT